MEGEKGVNRVKGEEEEKEVEAEEEEETLQIRRSEGF